MSPLAFVIMLVIAVALLTLMTLKLKIHPVMALFITATFCGLASGKGIVGTFSTITSYFGSTLGSIGVMIIFGAIKWNQIDDQLAGGVKLMGLIAFVMLIAGGYADVMKATGGVDALVQAGIDAMGGSKWIAATVITLIGLLVTMGIGTSFGTVPVLAVLFVPLCQHIGFSPAATIMLMSAAAALGDAGSPASDTTLGPTSGLNADGQHDHIWDTCVPTFIAFNIPLMICAIIVAQII